MISKIRILVVDDSAFMRKSLSIILGSDPEIEIIDTAVNGLEAVDKAKKLKPDLITLDIEMPQMDGLTALKEIMAKSPTSVIMVSSLTTQGADATLKALELGAVDFIPKEMSFVSVDMAHIKKDLTRKIRTIVRQKLLRDRISQLKSNTGFEKRQSNTSSSSRFLPKNNYKSIAIGISTGGPLSLQKVIPNFSGRLNVPIFIVQHMPPKFTQSLANRLNGMSKLDVKEAAEGEIVKKGTVYIAPGGHQLKVRKNNMGNVVVHISENPSNVLHKPSVDVMMESVLSIYGKDTLGIIMTGMGHDGLNGIKQLKSLGGHCIAQDEQSCVVYGMPKAVVDENLADVVASLEKIPEIVNMAI